MKVWIVVNGPVDMIDGRSITVCDSVDLANICQGERDKAHGASGDTVIIECEVID